MPPYFVDVWSAVHALECAAAAAILSRWVRPRVAALIVLGLALGWEVAEPLTVEVWFGFKEPWFNRWLSDPLADLLGVTYFFWKKPSGNSSSGSISSSS